MLAYNENLSGTPVIVALSGGVDSAVAAFLLKEAHYNVTGVIMRIWDSSLPTPATSRSACFGPDEEQDIQDAESICEKLGIDLHVVDCSSEFRNTVLSSFSSDYRKGRTPNPCVFCNRQMKFDLIQKKLHESGIDFEYFATGHYARIKNTGKGFSLLRAIDKHKDQSYFLYRLDRNQLAKTLFPLGEMTKHDVRKVAVSAVLSVSEKAESQDFYSGDYRELLKNLAVSTGNGNIIDQAGTILGTHTGIHNFTIGQRKGLGICSSEPLYVTGIDVNSKNIIVGPGSSRLKKSLVARDLNLLTDNTPQMLQARIRSTHKPADCSVKLTGDNMEVLFDDLQENITPGQSVVVYDGDIVIGGGIITDAY